MPTITSSSCTNRAVSQFVPKISSASEKRLKGEEMFLSSSVRRQPFKQQWFWYTRFVSIPDSSQNQQQLCSGFPAGQQLTVWLLSQYFPMSSIFYCPWTLLFPSSSLLGSLNQSEDWPEAHIISSPKTNHAQNKFSIWRESLQPRGKDFIRSCYPFPGDGIWFFLTIYSPGLCPVLFKWLK